jgi:hypothetical protein
VAVAALTLAQAVAELEDLEKVKLLEFILLLQKQLHVHQSRLQ